jgi:hypothetical protein
MWPNFINITGLLDRVFGFLSGENGVIGDADAALFWLGFWSMTLSIIFIIGITYLLIKFNESAAEERAKFAPVLQAGETATMTNPAWEQILRYLDSDNPSDWKFAIIESDAMLDELLKKMGLPGENMGERLKAVDPADFNTLDSAWEAHKLRNQIAHEAGFVLSQREVRRIVDMYERVFSEFKYI